MASKVPNFRRGNKLERRVIFELYAPLSEKVELAGCFNSWKPQANPLSRDAEGIWRLEILLPPGRYEYRFLIDGEWWQNDPDAAESVPNAFGTWNCVLKVE